MELKKYCHRCNSYVWIWKYDSYKKMCNKCIKDIVQMQQLHNMDINLMEKRNKIGIWRLIMKYIIKIIFPIFLFLLIIYLFIRFLMTILWVLRAYFNNPEYVKNFKKEFELAWINNWI